MKNIVVLGSTGSIGVNTLKVVERFPDKFRITGLTANNNHALLEKQIKKFKPKYVAAGEKARQYLKTNISTGIKILNAQEDLESLVSLKEVDIVVIAMSGSAALKPFLSAAKAGKLIAPANKEALVIAGNLIMKTAKQHGSLVVPVDSEQSAIFQCLESRRKKDLRKVILTASGGALRKVAKSQFDTLSVQQILNHPRWKMGAKITVDSATLMNKGFEVIEAIRLFDLNVNEVQVIIHPEAIIHSMVEFKDGSIMAQLGITDMRLPIQYALTYPDRLETGLQPLDFVKLGRLNFEKPDLKKFPALGLAFYVAGVDGSLPSVLNAADEEAVEAFIKGKIKFTQIFKTVEKVVLKHKIVSHPSLEKILEADHWAREQVKKDIG